MSDSVRRFLTIVIGATGLACLLGICMDLVTANVAVEYFSVHHPQIVATENPWVLAFVWGIAAAWWFGAICGAIVAWINHRRPEPLEPRRILKWTLIACVVLWVMMIAVLVALFVASGYLPVEERTESFESDRRLIAVAMTHQIEYVLGAIAMLIIAVMTWRAESRGAGDP